MNRAVFLDRDNTIIHNDGDLGEPEKVRLIQGAATSIASLCGLGYKIVVITNQGGVARGRYTEEDVMLVHERIAELVREAANGARIDRFYYCPFHPEGTVEAYRCEHPSRKPAPGMLLEAAQDLNIDLAQSWTIGDQLRDVEAGHAAGTRTILLKPDGAPLKETEQPGPSLRSGPASGVSPPDAGPERSEGPGSETGPPDYVTRNLTEAVRVIAHARRPEAAEHLHHAHVAGKRFDAATVARLQQQGRSGGGREGDAPSPAAEPERRTAGKPFRPWSLMPGDEDPEDADRGARVRSMFRKLRTEKEAEREASAGFDPAEASGPAAAGAPDDAPPPVSSVGVEGAAEPHEAVAERAATDEATAEEAAPAPVRAPISIAPRPADSRAPAAGEHTLRLILQELRNQRGTQGEFSYLFVVAIVLQMIAAVCVLGGLWMGLGNAELFFRWMMVALVMQMGTIAALLFGQHR